MRMWLILFKINDIIKENLNVYFWAKKCKISMLNSIYNRK